MAHSQVSDRLSCAGSVVIALATAQHSASAPRPASGGPSFVRGAVPWPGMRGRWNSIVNRVVRSTSVA